MHRGILQINTTQASQLLQILSSNLAIWPNLYNKLKAVVDLNTTNTGLELSLDEVEFVLDALGPEHRELRDVLLGFTSQFIEAGELPKP